jgi:hypothetical protein
VEPLLTPLYIIFIVILQETPLSHWLDDPHWFDNEIQQFGKQFRIPLICLDHAIVALPGKTNIISGRCYYEKERKILENAKETMNYFGIVYCR